MFCWDYDKLYPHNQAEISLMTYIFDIEHFVVSTLTAFSIGQYLPLLWRGLLLYELQMKALNSVLYLEAYV